MTELTRNQLVRACGGLDFMTHVRAFTEANARWTKIMNTYGRTDATRHRPDALKYERLMKMIDAFPLPYEKSI